MTDVPSAVAEEYEGGDYTLRISSQGFIWEGVTIDGKDVDCVIIDETVTIAEAVMKELDFGSHTLTLKNDFCPLVVTFVYSDVSQTAALTETDKTFTVGITRLKLSGIFDDGITVTALRRKGGNQFDWAYAEFKAISLSYVTVESDGIVLSDKLLNQVYGTCTYEIEFSNACSTTFTLTSNRLFFTDFDETMAWNSALTEDPGVCEIVSGVDGFDGSVLKVETKNWNTHEPYTWYTRVLCFSDNNAGEGWMQLPCSADKYYEFTFDMKVIMNGATHTNLGYYYTVGASGERAMNVDYTDGAVHRVSIVLKGSEFTYFAIGLDPRDGDLQSILYIDNFAVTETDGAAAQTQNYGSVLQSSLYGAEPAVNCAHTDGCTKKKFCVKAAAGDVE